MAICTKIIAFRLPAALFTWSDDRKGVCLPELTFEFRDGTGI